MRWPWSRKRATLIVMRLSDMHRVHPEMDIARTCSRCRANVGIYPSGQAALRNREYRMVIVCSVCQPPPAGAVLVPGAEAERGQSYPRGDP